MLLVLCRARPRVSCSVQSRIREYCQSHAFYALARNASKEDHVYTLALVATPYFLMPFREWIVNDSIEQTLRVLFLEMPDLLGNLVTSLVEVAW